MTPKNTPLVLRFIAKFVLDIMPAALASVIGGFLFSHYHWGYSAVPAPVGEQHAAASAEMMKLVRDEHTLIVDFLNAELKAERSRLTAGEKPMADQAPAHASLAAPVETRPAAAPPRRSVVAMTAPAAKPVTLRETAAAVPQRAFPIAVPPTPAPPPYREAAIAAHEASTPVVDTTVPRPPLPIGSARPSESGPSLITRAIDKTAAIKDGVVGATQHAADAIAGIPSWFAGSASRGEGPVTTSPSANLASAN